MGHPPDVADASSRAELSEAIAAAIGIDCSPEHASFEVVEEVRERGFVRQLIRFASGDGDGDEIPAFLAIPDGEPPFPAAVVFHQHNGERHLGKSEAFGLAGDRSQAFAPALARSGCVVLAPDSIAFEDRRDGVTGCEPDRRDWDQHYNQLAYRLVKGDTLARKVIADASMALTVLLGVPHVDPVRTGVIGHSYGGNTVLFLMAVDERARFGVASGAACTYRRKIADKTGIEMAEVIPGFAEKFDIDDLVRAAAPRPLLLVSGTEDKYAADADEIVDAAAGAYEAFGYRDRLSHARRRGGHALDDERFAVIVEWVSAQTARA